jgi:hypothetical protein
MAKSLRTSYGSIQTKTPLMVITHRSPKLMSAAFLRVLFAAVREAGPANSLRGLSARPAGSSRRKLLHFQRTGKRAPWPAADDN